LIDGIHIEGLCFNSGSLVQHRKIVVSVFQNAME